MFGKNTRLNPLESRKQLLIAESELNRAQLVGDMTTLAAGVRSLAHRAKSLGLAASIVALVMAGRKAFKHGKPAEADAKPSWMQTALKGAGLISTLWSAFRPAGRNQKRHEEDDL